MKTRPDFEAVISQFQCEGDLIDAAPYGSGHINDTYAAVFRKADGATHRTILQRINHTIFKDVPRLMQNIARVTGHLRKKIEAAGGDPTREALTIIPTVEGDAFYHSPAGSYWRAYVFIEGALTYDVVTNPEHIYNAARAFGRFQQLLGDFPAEELHETIPDFHHTRRRYDAFLRAVEQDAVGRARSVEAEIAFVRQRAEQTSRLVDLLARGELPTRVTHNDTKFNNVMIDDETGEGICVIDLDTVMPGSALYDFGDSVRSAANTASESERDLSRVHVDLGTFEQLVRGTLDAAGSFLTPLEIDLLPLSAWLMTFECGMRFLTDHLSGDVYFKIHREGHNLDRCRTQFQMVREMEEREGEMKGIVERYQ